MWMRYWLLGVLAVLCCWGILALISARLPPGVARTVIGFLPDCATTLRRIWSDARTPRRVRVVVGIAALWILSPIDLVPEFLPVIGPMDDAIVFAVALRYAVRHVPRDVVDKAWPGDPKLLDRILGE